MNVTTWDDILGKVSLAGAAPPMDISCSHRFSVSCVTGQQ